MNDDKPYDDKPYDDKPYSLYLIYFVVSEKLISAQNMDSSDLLLHIFIPMIWIKFI